MHVHMCACTHMYHGMHMHTCMYIHMATHVSLQAIKDDGRCMETSGNGWRFHDPWSREGLGFRSKGSGLRAWSLGLGAWGLGLRA